MTTEILSIQDHDLLHVKMFGEFSVKSAYGCLTASNKSGISAFLLIAYLIANKGTDITSDTLIEALWPDGDSDNPGGALRTLCYRTRKQLKGLFPDRDVELIRRNNNIYSWNFEIGSEIDVYEFENCCHRAFRETDPALQYSLLCRAFELYKGEFLPIFSDQSWVLFRSNYYGNMYLKCANLMCYHLSIQADYAGVLELCDKALELAPPTDETLHKQKLSAYLHLGKIQAALDYYYSILSLFGQKYGLDITNSMQDVYQDILRKMPNQYTNISTLEQNLRHKEMSDGSFYCNYDIFQNIYLINLRSVRRSHSRHFLILLTLLDNENPSLLTNDLREEMKLLQEVIDQRLRSNDVYTKSSICQFSLIIATPNENGYEIVVRRLSEHYAKKKKHSNIELQIDGREIQ